MSINNKTITAVHRGAVKHMIDIENSFRLAVLIVFSFPENMLGLPGAFADLQEGIIRFVLFLFRSVCPSVRSHGTTRLPLDGL
jgi:hypothetical protein